MSGTIHFTVTGSVQGVFFRMHTRQQALRHGLSGWVRNLPDGRVEGMASGDTDALKDLQDWLWRGPQRARVTAVEIQTLAFQPFAGFEIR
jgi:acylphosphatase